MIQEVLITTLSPSGVVNIAPMGIHIEQGLPLIMPFTKRKFTMQHCYDTTVKMTANF